jgi:hypothetical protein
MDHARLAELGRPPQARLNEKLEKLPAGTSI